MDDTTGPDFSGALRQEQFEGLLDRLDPDRERAGQLYESLRRRLIRFFEWNSCFPAEDLADKTLDRVAQKLMVETVHDLAAFAAGVAKHVRQEAYKQSARTIQASDLSAPASSLRDPANPEKILQDKVEGQQRSRCLLLCIRRWEERDRRLFLRYHAAEDDRMRYRRELAENHGMTIGTLRVRINRLRDELENCARRCIAASARKGFGNSKRS
jgi:DNA-directed RNA polymerase specialized sigma24 family protein